MNRTTTFYLLGVFAAMTPIANSMAQTDSATTPAYNVADLNPAFLLTPEDVKAAIKRGDELASKRWTDRDFITNLGQRPLGIRGNRGYSHESSVLCLSLGGLSVTQAEFHAKTEYRKLDLPAGVDADHGGFRRDLVFLVSLNSMPDIRRNGRAGA